MSLDDFKVPQLSAFSLHVTVYIKPEDVDKFLAAFKPAFDQTVATPECVYFEVFQDPENLGTLSWLENWNASAEWFMKTHLAKDYYKPYLEATLPMMVKDREFKILKRMGPDLVASKPENLQ